MIEEIPGPVWQDGCGHGKKYYVGSYEVIESRNHELVHDLIDLYVFSNPSLGQEVCLRFGNEDSAYYSPGRVQNVIADSHICQVYGLCHKMLNEKGKFKWSKNDE